MIIRRLHLHPFAGTADRGQNFQPGLNVILGPNEAGKTTLRNALWQALFVSTSLTKRERDREVLPYLPLGGGDTIRVGADLEVGGQTWQVRKQWSREGGTSELILPEGGVITDPGAVDAQLAELLVLKPGTWRHALFASQGSAASALEEIVRGEPVHDLSEVLRRSGFETDGVSIEALGSSIQGQWENAWGRWDRDMNRPEGNRGIESPWSRGVGSILGAWYDQERARQALEEAEAYYRDLDAITERLNAAATESEALKSWVAEYTAAAKDSEQRVRLEPSLGHLRSQEAALRTVSQEWPVAVSKVTEFQRQSTALQENARVLEEEQEQAQAWEDAGQKRIILGQAQELDSKITKARESLQTVTRIDQEQLQELEELDKEQDRIRARLEAAELNLRFQAAKPVDIEVQAGLEGPEEHSFAEDEVLEFTAGARALIRHRDWVLEVRSGNVDVASEEARYRKAQERAAKLLGAMGADTLSSAKRLYADYKEKADHLSGLERQLAELLNDQSLDDLQAEVQAAGGGEAPRRSAAVVAAERATATSDADTARKGASELQQKIQAWEETYDSQEGLLDRLVALRGDRMEVEKKLEALLPLPEGFEDAQEFLDRFEERKEAVDQAKDEFNGLLVDKASFEGRAPDLEPAEAGEQLQQAQEAFDQALRHGEAIDRIRQDFQRLRAEMDEGTLEPWLEHLKEVVAPLSGNRYGGMDLDTNTFSQAGDGPAVPFQVLSMGTRATLALALRLSMARWFLKDREGFLVLDDPLVDLDPQRQREAAAMLKRFAEDKQVILMTCHPSHAEILGGVVLEV